MHRKTSLLGRSFFKKRRFPQKLISTFKTLSERIQRDCPSVRGGASLDINVFFRVADAQLRGFLQWGETANF